MEVNGKRAFNLTEKGDQCGTHIGLRPDQVLEQVYVVEET